MILFDFDGTLIKDKKQLYKLWKNIFKKFGKTLTYDEYKNDFITDWKEYVIQKLAIKPAEIEKELEKKYIKIISERKIVPNLIRFLQHNQFGIITSGFSEGVKKVCNNSGITPEFIMSSTEEKTSSKIQLLKRTLEKYGLNPENCTYIGDTEYDIIAAKKNGIKSIAVTWGLRKKEKLTNADVIIDTPGQLINELK